MYDDTRAFDEYFDIETLESLSASLKILLEELADRQGEGFSPRRLQTNLHAIFSAFDSQLNEINPRQTIVNFIKLGYPQLAYYWNLSRQVSLTGVLNKNTVHHSYTQVCRMVRNAALIQEVNKVNADLVAIDERFTEITGLTGDL